MFLVLTVLFLGGKIFCTEEKQAIREPEAWLSKACEHNGNVVLLVAVGFIGMSLTKMCKTYMEKKRAKKIKNN